MSYLFDRHDLTASRARRTYLTRSHGRPMRVSVTRDRHIWRMHAPHDEALSEQPERSVSPWWLWPLLVVIIVALAFAGPTG